MAANKQINELVLVAIVRVFKACLSLLHFIPFYFIVLIVILVWSHKARAK